MKNRFRVLLPLMISIPLACNTLHHRLIDPYQFIIKECKILLSLQWHRLKDDPHLRQVINADEFDQILEEYNLKNDHIDQIIYFSDELSDLPQRNAFILSGDFDTEKVYSSLIEQGWEEWKFGSYMGLVNEQYDPSLLVVDDRVVLIGNRRTISECIDAYHHDEKRLLSHSTAKRVISHFQIASYPISFMVFFPEEYQDVQGMVLKISTSILNISGISPLAKILNEIGYIRGLGYAISHENGDLPVELLAVMKDENSASLISGAILLLQKITAFLPERNLSYSELESKRAFEKLQVKREADILSVHLRIPVSSVQ